MTELFFQVDRDNPPGYAQIEIRELNSEGYEAVDVGEPVRVYLSESMTTPEDLVRWLDGALPTIQRFILAKELKDLSVGYELKIGSRS